MRSQAARQGPQRAPSGGNAGQAFLAQLQRGGSGGTGGLQHGTQGPQPYTATGSPAGQALLSALQRGAEPQPPGAAAGVRAGGVRERFDPAAFFNAVRPVGVSGGA